MKIATKVVNIVINATLAFTLIMGVVDLVIELMIVCNANKTKCFVLNVNLVFSLILEEVVKLAKQSTNVQFVSSRTCSVQHVINISILINQGFVKLAQRFYIAQIVQKLLKFALSAIKDIILKQEDV